MTFETMVGLLAQGFLKTLAIFGLTLLGAIPLGVVIMLLRKSKLTLVRILISAYISIIRGTPLMLQLMVVYFGPNLLLGMNPPGNWRSAAVIIAFVLNYAAYFAEIFRGGLESISIGQYEAAEVLGYTKTQCFFKIILPQMIKRSIPPTTNEVITLVKDTSLASVIGEIEMFTKAKQINALADSPGMITFVVAALFYYVFNWVVATLMSLLEKKLDYYH